MAMLMTPALHLLGSAADGGAETYFIDLVTAQRAAGRPVSAALRQHEGREAALARSGTPFEVFKFGSPLDLATRRHVRHAHQRGHAGEQDDGGEDLGAHGDCGVGQVGRTALEGVVVRWCGGAVVRWCGGAVVRWCGRARRCDRCPDRGAPVRWHPRRPDPDPPRTGR